MNALAIPSLTLIGLFASASFGQTGTVNEDVKAVASDGMPRDLFGLGVDIHDGLIVVGAGGDDERSNTDSGSVYVIDAATGAELEKIVPAGLDSEDGFGIWVSVYGDTLVASAQGDDDSGSQAGAVYVYVQSPSGWTLEQKVTASDGASNDLFGSGVELVGDTLVVGARGAGLGGAAYVFDRSGGVWTETQKLTASDAQGGDLFGLGLAFDGQRIVVGAELADDPMGVASGAAYVFFDRNGFWVEEAKLTPSDGAFNDRFGFSADVVGETIVVGSPNDVTERGLPTDIQPTIIERTGSAYVFELDRFAGWTQIRKLVPNDGISTDRFGNDVALNGQTVYVSAINDDDTAQDAGSVYSYRYSLGTELERFLASDGAEGDHFGAVISIFEGTLVVGQPFDNMRRPSLGNPGPNEPGSAYVFFVPAACVGDFDGDGDVDLGDFGVFGAAFGSVAGDPNYNTQADFDGDGDVDLGDFGVFGAEYGRTDCP